MPTVAEAEERVSNFFHVVLRSLPAGHSIDQQNCWACRSAAEAVLTPISKQKAMAW